jgi:hypothetical protein
MVSRMIYDNAPTVGLVAEAHGRMPMPSATDHIEPWLNGRADFELLSRASNNLLQHWPAYGQKIETVEKTVSCRFPA